MIQARLHISPTSILFFKNIWKKDIRVLNWFWIKYFIFCSRISKLYSVEHNEEWYNLINENSSVLNCSNVDYRFVLQNDKSDFVDDVFDLEEKRDFEIRRDYVNYFQALNDIQAIIH